MPRKWTTAMCCGNQLCIMLQRSPRAGGLTEPCLPSPAKAPPSGPEWIHEIKRDGFRILARRDGVRLTCHSLRQGRGSRLRRAWLDDRRDEPGVDVVDVAGHLDTR
jgi:hypothetical protein